MTYGYMRTYEDRVRRAVNTPDRNGRFALWQGGMEPNIPVGSAAGVARGMEKAVAGAEREQREGASGKWVAHWKMVHIVRPVWERAGRDNQLEKAIKVTINTLAQSNENFSSGAGSDKDEEQDDIARVALVSLKGEKSNAIPKTYCN